MHGRIRVRPGHSLRSGHSGPRWPHAWPCPRPGTPHPAARRSGPRCARPTQPSSSWAARTSTGREGWRHATLGHSSGYAELLSLGPGGDDGGHGTRRPHDAGGDTRDTARWHASRGHTARWKGAGWNTSGWNHAWWNTVGRRKACGWEATRPRGHSGWYA